MNSLEGEPFSLSSWEMKKQRTKGLEQKRDTGTRTGEQEDEIRRTNPIQMRDGDWRCAMEECRGEINFARRRECWKCGADKSGNRRLASETPNRSVQNPHQRRGDRSYQEKTNLGLSPTDRLKMRVEEQR